MGRSQIRGIEVNTVNGWAIICDARLGEAYDVEILALVDRSQTTSMWWTSDDVELMMCFTHREAAMRSVRRLKHNNPRVVPYIEAARIIAKQQIMSLEAAARMAENKGDDDFESDMSHSFL